MRRRRALESLAVVGGVSLAGCSSAIRSGGPGTILGRIDVVNLSFVPNRIRLTVDRSGETLVERTIDLTAINAEDGAAWTSIEPSWVQTGVQSTPQDQYTIRALHIGDDGDRESDAWEYTFTRRDYTKYYEDRVEDPGCIGAIVKVGSLDDEENAAIGIGPTYMEDPCALDSR